MGQAILKSSNKDEQTLIIQCPSCQTQFAVDRGSLPTQEAASSLATVRFHCSRCDQVFSGEDAGVKESLPAPLREKPATSSASSMKQDEDEGYPTIETRIEQHEDREFADLVDEMAAMQGSFDPLSSEQLSEDYSQPEQIRQAELPWATGGTHSREDTPEQTSRAGESWPSRSLSLPRLGALSQQISAPHESAPEPRNDAEADRANENAARSMQIKGLGLSQLQMALGGSAKPPTDTQKEKSEEDFSKYAVTFSESDPADVESPTQEFIRQPQPKGDGPKPPSTYPPYSRSVSGQQEIGGGRGLAIISLGILGFLLALAAIAGILSISPQQSASIAATVMPEQPQVPPSTLYLKDTRLELVALDNGEMVHLISGSLVNEGSQEFQEILLEGLLFGRGGEILARQRIRAGANLAKARIRSLSAEALMTMQEGRAARGFELPTGGSAPVSIVLPAEPNVHPQSFATRIHSVR